MIIEFWKMNVNPITLHTNYPQKDYSNRRIDLDNYGGKVEKRINKGRAITLEDIDGNKQSYTNCKLAAKAMGISSNKLYKILNGHLKNNTNFKITENE